MATKSTATTRDYGTVELARRFTIVPKLASLNTLAGKVVDETCIDRYLLSDDISSTEHGMLCGLLARLRRGSFTLMKSPDFEASLVHDPAGQADRKAEAIAEVVYLIRDMDKAFGSHKRKALVNLVLIDIEWPYALIDLKDCIRRMEIIFSRN